MVGKTDFDFLSEEQAKGAFKDDNYILKTGKPIVDKIERITDSTGVERLFSVTKVPWFDSKQNIIGTMGISRDVSDLKNIRDIKKVKIIKL